MSILNLVFGGLSVLQSLYALLIMDQLKSVATPYQAFLLPLHCLLELAGGVLGIVAGVGLIRVAPWARGWALGYAIAGLARMNFNIMVGLVQPPTTGMAELVQPPTTGLAVIVASVIGALLVGCAYPVILLYFLNSTGWIRALNAEQVPDGTIGQAQETGRESIGQNR